jgi:uncharacterized protein YndB with AHSA1/START domain
MTSPHIPSSPPTTDCIDRAIVIQAPRGKVWQALASAQAFGCWFGANLTGQEIAAGQHVRGPITIPGYEHVVFDALVDKVEPESLLSLRWHPYAVDAAVDYSQEERTLVTFTLEESAGGKATLLRVVETGFDKLPPERWQVAMQMNARGWEAQLHNVQAYACAP